MHFSSEWGQGLPANKHYRIINSKWPRITWELPERVGISSILDEVIHVHFSISIKWLFFSSMLIINVVSSPRRGCGRWAAGWTGVGPTELGSCSRDRPPERRCPAGSPLQSDTGSQNEASLNRAHLLQGPWRQAAGKRWAVVRQPSSSNTPQADMWAEYC